MMDREIVKPCPALDAGTSRDLRINLESFYETLPTDIEPHDIYMKIAQAIRRLDLMSSPKNIISSSSNYFENVWDIFGEEAACREYCLFQWAIADSLPIILESLPNNLLCVTTFVKFCENFSRMLSGTHTHPPYFKYVFKDGKFVVKYVHTTK